ncbi:MAG TPA: ATP-binding protein [Ignavibacteriaceae bacterium]|nr:ATP-binding protein [Ignavibacteriaceae bacterium]
MNENPDKTKLTSSFSFLENPPEELKSLLELSDDLVFQLDLSGNLKSINKNGILLLDYNTGELADKYFIELFKLSSRPIVLTALQEAINENKITTFEAGILGKYGDEFSFKFRVKAVTENREIKGIIGIGKNLVFIKKLETKIFELSEKLKETKRIISIERSRGQQQISVLEELNRMKAEFVSNISHEFRTPLASIIGFSESISSDPTMLPEHQKEFNEIILSEGKRLAKLINDVLDLTRLEKGEVDLNKTKFNCILLIEKVIDKFSDEIKRKDLNLTKDFPDEEVFVHGDKEKLAQVFYHLIENAIKFTGRGGRISILAHALYKEIEVIITDTGIGIVKKDLPYIFQKYYRDNKSIEQLGEKGLGLVFVKHIVDLHNGSISVQSEVNEGTTIIVKLLTEE